MPGGSTRTFLDSDQYEGDLRQAQIQSLITPQGEFNARLTWAELNHLRLLYCEEAFPRIAYLCLPPHLVFVAFPHSGPMPVWNGMQMQAGDVMLHGRGQRLHQSTLGFSGWSVIMADPEWLDNSYRALTGKPLVMPAEGCVLQPTRQNSARLRRLHAQACRLAETKPKMLAHFEVARAIEQNVFPTLIDCLTTVRVRRDAIPRPRCPEIMIKLEEVLGQHLAQTLRMPDLCELVGVTDRTLRSCCDKFLGISPVRYLRLRQLTRARIALRKADPLADIAEIATAHGFDDPGQFVKIYRATFGETPFSTLQRPRTTDFIAP
jgi:AraC-like DNA-binding protein